MDEINIKILLVGDTRVGKTSILFRYIDDTFPNDHLATIGVEYRFKISEFHGFKIEALEKVGNRLQELFIKRQENGEEVEENGKDVTDIIEEFINSVTNEIK